MITPILLIISLLINGVLGYLCYINANKLSKAVAIAELQARLILNFYIKTRTTLKQLVEVDHRGSFQADDEVGFVFQDIKANVETLKEYLNTYITDETAKSEKK